MTLQPVENEPDPNPDTASTVEAIVLATARRTPVVDLHPWEYANAYRVGIERAAANWNTHDRVSYQNDRKQQECLASPAAAIAECAVAKHLCLNWSGSVWPHEDHHLYKHLPDVEPNVEVRRVREPNGSAAVRSKDLGRGLMLVVAYPEPPEFRSVQILGWLPVDEAWEIGAVAFYDKTGATRVVKPSQLRHTSTYPNLLR